MDNTLGTPPDLAASADTPRVSSRHNLMHWLVLIAIVCWAVNIIAVKEALRGLGAVALVQVRMLGAALVFAGSFLAWRRRPSLKLSAREWGIMATLAVSGVICNQLFFILGLARTSVAHAALIVALGPVMVLILATALRLEVLTGLKLVGMLVAFAGVGILTTGKAAHGNGAHWQGDLIILVGSAVFAYYTIVMKEVSQRYDALTLNTVSYGLGVLIFIPFGARAALAAPWSMVKAPVVWAVLYMIIFGSVIPYMLYAFAMTELAASRVAAFNYLQPVIGTGLGIWLLGERLTAGIVLGGTIILLGVYLTERERGEEKEPARPLHRKSA